MPSAARTAVPASHARRFLEPGPVVMLTTHAGGADNVMTMGWHQVLDFTPSLVSCVVAKGNRSHEMLRASGECVINVPTADMLDTVVRVGNCSGNDNDKFAKFAIERTTSQKVAAPSLPQCHASLECRIHDDRAAERYNLFILEVLHIDAREHPKAPEYAHYVGDGEFMLSGQRVSRRHLFRADMLGI